MPDWQVFQKKEEQRRPRGPPPEECDSRCFGPLYAKYTRGKIQTRACHVKLSLSTRTAVKIYKYSRRKNNHI